MLVYSNLKHLIMKNLLWTTEHMPDLTGKIIVVTGGNSGLGYESVKAFAMKGAEVVLASRSAEKGEEARAEILKDFPEGKIKVMQLDLGDQESVSNFASVFKKSYKKLDVLLNNAGIMMTPYFTNKNGRCKNCECKQWRTQKRRDGFQ